MTDSAQATHAPWRNMTVPSPRKFGDSTLAVSDCTRQIEHVETITTDSVKQYDRPMWCRAVNCQRFVADCRLTVDAGSNSERRRPAEAEECAESLSSSSEDSKNLEVSNEECVAEGYLVESRAIFEKRFHKSQGCVVDGYGKAVEFPLSRLGR